MRAKLKRTLRLYRLFARMDFMWLTQDTGVCLLCMFSDLLANLASVSGVFLLSIRFGGVGGMSADEFLLMLGFYTLAEGFTFMFFEGYNTGHISRRIGRGQLDHMLIQPTPLWMQVLTEGFLPFSGSMGFLCGVGVTAIAIRRLALPLTPAWLGVMALYVLTRSAIVIGANYWLGAIAFYRPASSEEMSPLVSDLFNTLGKYPLAGLPGWLTGALLTVIPVGLTAYLPSLILLGRVEQPALLALPLVVAAILLSLATHAFRKGMRYYVQKGCPRYSAMGHRN